MVAQYLGIGVPEASIADALSSVLANVCLSCSGDLYRTY